MTRFLVTYHGGKPPADGAMADQMKLAFSQWLQQAGEAVADPGAPVRPVASVPSGAISPPGEIGGYSIVEAASVELAIALLTTHPFVARGGTLRVHEALAVS